MTKTKHKAKRISAGYYEYRGYPIISFFSFKEQRECWEAISRDGCEFAQSHSIKETKAKVDYEIDKKQKTIKVESKQ